MRVNFESNNNNSMNLNRGEQSNQGSGKVISLSKGQNISLTKELPSLKQILVGLGWDTNDYVGAAYDLDVSAFMLGVNGKVPNSDYFVFYSQLVGPNNSVVHTGDNLTGEGDGDDESLIVDLTKVPTAVDKIVFTVTIHDAQLRSQSFGQVRNAFIRLVDDNTKQEVLRFDLTENFSTETSVVVAELYRYQSEWKFKAVGAGYNTNLADFCDKFGIQVG